MQAVRDLVFVVYDGITNSVFAGQVLAPLIARLNADQQLRVHLVSFERRFVASKLVQIPEHLSHRFFLTTIARWPFWCASLLRRDARSLRTLLRKKDFQRCDVIARGPLAGYIALRAADQRCAKITVQARGLLAEEYRLAHNTHGALSVFHRLRAWCYERAERAAYADTRCVFEAVSPALREYIHVRLGASVQHINLAHEDVPERVAVRQVAYWRAYMRRELGFSPDMRVYCVCASVQVWQEPHLVVDFFKRRLELEPRACLLVLTTSPESYQHALQQAHVPVHATRVLSVPHEQIYQCLSAADVGLVLRDCTVASWVARPVKAMEYEAVGLEIMHNNSVDWMIARYGVCRSLE